MEILNVPNGEAESSGRRLTVPAEARKIAFVVNPVEVDVAIGFGEHGGERSIDVVVDRPEVCPAIGLEGGLEGEEFCITVGTLESEDAKATRIRVGSSDAKTEEGRATVALYLSPHFLDSGMYFDVSSEETKRLSVSGPGESGGTMRLNGTVPEGGYVKARNVQLLGPLVRNGGALIVDDPIARLPHIVHIEEGAVLMARRTPPRSRSEGSRTHAEARLQVSALGEDSDIYRVLDGVAIAGAVKAGSMVGAQDGPLLPTPYVGRLAASKLGIPATTTPPGYDDAVWDPTSFPEVDPRELRFRPPDAQQAPDDPFGI